VKSPVDSGGERSLCCDGLWDLGLWRGFTQVSVPCALSHNRPLPHFCESSEGAKSAEGAKSVCPSGGAQNVRKKCLSLGRAPRRERSEEVFPFKRLIFRSEAKSVVMIACVHHALQGLLFEH